MLRIINQQLNWILSWSRLGESRSVYAANVHMLVEAHDTVEFQKKLNSADLVTPDGMPLVQIMREKGYKDQNRVYGPILMLKVLESAAIEGISIGFLGSTKDVLGKLSERMQLRFPRLIIGAAVAPPFRLLTEEENLALIREINDSGIKILFVGLGCPKQEIWIAKHRGKVGTQSRLEWELAFNFHAGMVRQAPHWIRRWDLSGFFDYSRSLGGCGVDTLLPIDVFYT